MTKIKENEYDEQTKIGLNTENEFEFIARIHLINVVTAYLIPKVLTRSNKWIDLHNLMLCNKRFYNSLIMKIRSSIEYQLSIIKKWNKTEINTIHRIILDNSLNIQDIKKIFPERLK